MKQRDIKPCGGCGRGVGHGGTVLFYRVILEHLCVDVGAVQRHSGLEAMLGGRLAQVMGPDEDIAMPLGVPVEFLLCQEYAVTHCFASIEERARLRQEKNPETES